MAIASAAWAQDGLNVVAGAYRQGATADRMVIEAPRAKGPAARGEMVVAVRPGDSPAVSLSLGSHDPLRVLAEPGRLLAWREGDRSRVFAAALGEPFGRAAIEAVIPPVLAPQIDLALAGEPGALLAIMPALSWSRVARGEADRYLGVSPRASLTLAVGPDGRLLGMEAQRGGVVLARAGVSAVQVDPAWFDAPPLDGTIVASLAELGTPPGPARVGEPFGHALGVDARGRATTLAAVAGNAQNLVVLLVDARREDAWAPLAGALAQADLAGIAALLDATVVVLSVGGADAAALFERVTASSRSSRSDTPRVRALAIDGVPPWAPLPGGGIEPGVAYAVDGDAWVLRGVHAVAGEGDANAGGDDPPVAAPFASSHAPRSLAERLAEAVGAAARE
jgi:hypothetical protein